ncbi:uroporphyrinogen-III synthase [Robertkochia sediminum]|uniref:uroporphyrinogen-III synthase n=1 Tax=Robertkochia sediminum TaxID=2785326 RepID=UPI0019331A75|nr:uroporphyrinogen-III synthase [Robertkochia sediminum]MBL7471839.1 uroporphyrinogen-III synthase [Robertkochia sediminum]
MASNIRILSTRTLTEPQRERLLAAGFALTEIPFIKTEQVPFTAPDSIARAIITSNNAAKAIANKQLRIDAVFCVGQKTATTLSSAGYKVEITADNAGALAEKITDAYQGEEFYFLGTRSRRDELPEHLKANNTPLKEIEVYKTLPESHRVPGNYDGILFFSPSAVDAFSRENSFKETVCFSIGPTTAQALEAHTKTVVTAKQPSAEHLILETVKYFKSINAHNRETSI